MTTVPAAPSLEEYARRLVAAAPPLTAEQRDLIRGLFAPAVAELAAQHGQQRRTA